MQLNLTEQMNCAVMTLNIFSTNNVGFDACNTPKNRPKTQESIDL